MFSSLDSLSLIPDEQNWVVDKTKLFLQGDCFNIDKVKIGDLLVIKMISSRTISPAYRNRILRCLVLGINSNLDKITLVTFVKNKQGDSVEANIDLLVNEVKCGSVEICNVSDLITTTKYFNTNYLAVGDAIDLSIDSSLIKDVKLDKEGFYKTSCIINNVYKGKLDLGLVCEDCESGLNTLCNLTVTVDDFTRGAVR